MAGAVADGHEGVAIGDPAPDFELPDQHGQPVRLSSYRGRGAVLLVFFPWAFTGICGSELHALEKVRDELDERGVTVLAVSTDSMYVQRVFADREGFTFTLLADFWPHGGVAAAYGALVPAIGVARRASFLVDREGVVRWSVLNDIGQERRVEDVLDAVDAL